MEPAMITGGNVGWGTVSHSLAVGGGMRVAVQIADDRGIESLKIIRL